MGQTFWDLAAGASVRGGLEGRARIGRALTPSIDFAAEGFVDEAPGQPFDAGILAGIGGHF